ncbi:fumarylacetoacetate hydrolase family protein [Amorphus orientalis]|uniref:2-keto-4-pentenoate hydratase/2-oxohepta-3-ene-1,7-dioic acid hydratase in catechol pathway n=1 Tax=Amorphus orientalis TaxID=649198 RepID=A0AAE4ASF4_9HYPH|nr:fumarylacetoacetate hydrolase family protein [Amorphus orientalis]MDQ0315193.1 2-keto-4-pentenoate hydratase/2-oxohepta-3-ene-1,7-dioic acid hydratase in catechol pathway [Amorphus orientalis]
MTPNTEIASSWALATVGDPSDPIACLEAGGKLYRLAPSLSRVGGAPVDSVVALFDDWAATLPMLEKAAAAVDETDLVPETTRLAPILYPGKVLCAGANYYAHLAEMGMTNLAKEAQRLFFFFKPARNAVVGEGETVAMPLDTQAMDWEIELAAVIGKSARAVSVEDALSHVAAYSIALDISARDLNQAPDTFYKLDWVAGKAQDTSCPMGPRLIPASAVSDPQALALKLWVNDELKQDDTTGDMIFSIAEQISIASRIMTLDPGDVILTGTPAGVGAPKKTFLSVGDRIDAEIAGIGHLSVVVQAPRGA